MRRRSLAWAWPLWLALVSPALAAPSARLTYLREPGAESCTEEDGLRRAVAARLGYDPFFPWAKVTVVAHVRKDAGAYRAEVTLVDEGGVSRGTRSLSSEGDDCAPLVGALALSISLALDPLSLTRSPTAEETPPTATAAPRAEPPPLPLPPPPPPPPSSAGAKPPVVPGPRTESEWHGWGGIAADASYGATPGFAFGGLLRGEIGRGRLSLALEARVDAPTSAAAPTGGRVEAWLAQGTLLGCGRVSILVGCALVSGGPLVTSGIGLRAPRSATLAYGAVGPRLGVEWPLGARFRLEVFSQIAFTLAPRTLQVDGLDAFRQPVAAPSLGAGVSARIF